MPVPHEIVARPGDVAANDAPTDKAQNELGREAQYGIEDMVRDTWSGSRGTRMGLRIRASTGLPVDGEDKFEASCVG